MSETIRVFSLTDIENPNAKAAGFSGATLTVDRHIFAPGDERSIEDTDTVRRHLHEYIVADAMAVGSPPAWYRVAKEKRK